MNSCKRPSDHSRATEEAGFQGGVLARRAFSVVLVADDDPPSLVLIAILLGNFGHAVPLATAYDRGGNHEQCGSDTQVVMFVVSGAQEEAEVASNAVGQVRRKQCRKVSLRPHDHSTI